MPENYANRFASTLDGGIDASQTTMDLISVTDAPDPTCRFLIESEIVLATLLAGNTYTIERAAEGTTAAVHADGATVTHLLTAGALDQIQADICIKAPFADLGDYTKPGALFLPETAGVLSPGAAGSNVVLTPSGSVNIGPFWQMKRPVLSDFTAHDSPTINDQGGVIYLKCPAYGSGDRLRGLKRAYSGKLRAKIYFSHHFKVANYAFVGLGFRSSANNRSTTMICHEAGNGRGVCGISFDDNTFSSQPIGSNAQVGYGHGIWFMCEDDATNLKFYWSTDGRNFFQYGNNIARTSFITGGPNEIFIMLCSNNSTIDVHLTLYSYEEESFV